MKLIAIFASGTGTNAEKLIRHFEKSKTARVGLIVCNKPGAGVIRIAEHYNIPLLLIEKEKFFRGNHYIDELRTFKIDLIVLAGFLWKIPSALIEAYREKIINIHPALLPKHGGKGMYGAAVHNAVISSGEKESGITIHFVDEHYDNGDIIFQTTCKVDENESAESLAEKVHHLEHTYFPRVIEEIIKNEVRS